MANFGTMTGGVEHRFSHPCFAWLGQRNRVTWDAIRFYPGDGEADLELFLRGLLASSLRHEEGFTAQIVEGKRKHKCIEVPLEPLRERPYWQVLRILKFGFKVFGYSPGMCKGLMEGLSAGANFQVATLAVSEDYGYHYPHTRYPKGGEELLFNFLEGGPMVDLAEWTRVNRPQGLARFDKPDCDLGASGGCHPLTMDWGGTSGIYPDDDYNKGHFNLETFEKNLERIHKEWAERKGGVK